MFRKKRSVWLFLLPGLAGLMLFYIVPFIGGIWYSLTDGSYENRFVGLANYAAIWQNEMFLLGLKNTMLLSLICAPLVWALSFVIAALLNRLRPGGAFFRNSILLPYLMPSSAMLLIWLLLFDYGGVVNRLIAAFGGERVLWLEGAQLRVPIVLLFVWKNLGFAVVIFLAALQTVPEPLYEYADARGRGLSAPDVRHHASADRALGVSDRHARVDQRVQDLQGGLLHRRRVSGRGGLHASELHEQHVRAAELPKRHHGGVQLRADRVRAVRGAVPAERALQAEVFVKGGGGDEEDAQARPTRRQLARGRC